MTFRDLAEILKDKLKTQDFLDVGPGAEKPLGVSPLQLKAALSILRDEGYEVHRFTVTQFGTTNTTTYQVLAKPGTSWTDARKNYLQGDNA